MKFVELIVEGYGEQLEIDLQDLLAAAKGRNISEIPTGQLVMQLQGMGHNVNGNSIMTILNGNPYVQTATPELVNLTSDDEAAISGAPDAAEQNRERVAQLAQNTADSSIGNDLV